MKETVTRDPGEIGKTGKTEAGETGDIEIGETGDRRGRWGWREERQTETGKDHGAGEKQ